MVKLSPNSEIKGLGVVIDELHILGQIVFLTVKGLDCSLILIRYHKIKYFLIVEHSGLVLRLHYWGPQVSLSANHNCCDVIIRTSVEYVVEILHKQLNTHNCVVQTRQEVYSARSIEDCCK